MAFHAHLRQFSPPETPLYHPLLLFQVSLPLVRCYESAGIQITNVFTWIVEPVTKGDGRGR